MKNAWPLLKRDNALVEADAFCPYGIERETFLTTKHLDIGCGNTPRNPYLRDELYGVDISSDSIAELSHVRTANLAVERIPFEDNLFDSVSAYDFIEHVPRAIYLSDKVQMRFPFVELMHEIWRVLKAGGLFYASTPVYPMPQAFIDPTHVNFVTDGTHSYFTQPELMARMYGFKGCFDVVRAKRVRPFYDYEPNNYSFNEKIRKTKDFLRRRRTHVLWELIAIKGDVS